MIEYLNENLLVLKLQIWDSMWHLRFKKYINIWRHISGGIIVYDISNKETFDVVELQINDIESYDAEAKVVLVGNK